MACIFEKLVKKDFMLAEKRRMGLLYSLLVGKGELGSWFCSFERVSSKARKGAKARFIFFIDSSLSYFTKSLRPPLKRWAKAKCGSNE